MELDKVFDSWFANIQKATFIDSHYRNIAKHPDTLNILKMGKKSIPYLMKRIDETPHVCFYILGELGIERPYPPEDAGYVTKMAKAWKDWYNNTPIIE